MAPLLGTKSWWGWEDSKQKASWRWHLTLPERWSLQPERPHPEEGPVLSPGHCSPSEAPTPGGAILATQKEVANPQSYLGSGSWESPAPGPPFPLSS